MNKEKSIRACYEEIKRREVRELENALRAADCKVEFSEDNAPIVMCNFNGFEPHPADVRITRVELRDEEDEDVLYIFGQEKDSSGCASWFDEEREINVSDIAYGHVDFITNSIPNKKKIELGDDMRRFCETVSELSNLLYGILYLKDNDSYAVNQEIINLAVRFEESFDRHTDFLEEIDKFAKAYVKEISFS